MTLKATIDTTGATPVLTVTSDRRKIAVQVTSAGETVTATGTWPVTVVDSTGRVWKQQSDDGTTAVYS